MQSKPRKAAVKLRMPADGMALPLIDKGDLGTSPRGSSAIEATAIRRRCGRGFEPMSASLLPFRASAEL